MYPTHRLETPPPSSQFHRPWSPETYETHQPMSLENVGYGPPLNGEQRRLPSESNVEALDLADYGYDSGGQGSTQPQGVFQPYDAYPPSPQPFRSPSSMASASTPPLTSPSPTTSHSYSGASSRSSAPTRPHYRPFSFPVPSVHSSSAHGHTYTARYTAAHDHDPLQTPPAEPDDEIDIAQFPAFARNWYAKPRKTNGDVLEQYAPFQVDPFDPSFPTNEFGGYNTPPPLYASPHGSAYASRSSRDLGMVPWSGDAPEDGKVDPQVKEERMRMLEREFAGKNGQAKGDEEEHMIGSVDAKGHLVTAGPKKRTFTRWIQALLALLAAGSGIYAAAFIKASPPPPPAGKPPAYVLYVLSVITFLLTSYLFILYPACCGRRQRKGSGAHFTGDPSGMMVLPVQSLPGGKPKKKGKKGKDGKDGDGVQVNLIVDPGMLNGDLDDDSDESEVSGNESTVPGSYSGRTHRSRRKRRAAKRRSIFAGLALEAQWKQARKMLKWGMTADVILFFAWGAEFIYILIGKRCPSGHYDGWCDAYNVATAASCLVCLAFGFGIFFDIKDLHASNVSPRHRTSV